MPLKFFFIVLFVTSHLKGRFFVFFTIGFLLFLAPAGGTNPNFLLIKTCSIKYYKLYVEKKAFVTFKSLEICKMFHEVKEQ